ncbi:MULTISPECIES: cryptochrome/photolyase family protein [Enterococcus]|uniref:cryptochrome/photolyase family protein n=1 Tax=Enterococcus TaxID=1350 RepID=UPI000F803231|nr:deoxyribodipyrimidine photo-lyase [Enterococcus faecalis]HBD5769979.1 deoxyribodipyrimidine photo-lyase [Escherichia coli]EJB2748891.1 deoxyribodipyrimidine photo-lyase [Enterococcus faecalis]MBV6953791.1 deoxyribodipyrimidine photo-lyase [Enterococcus faecalis]MCD4978471.1 deoxyribodipyrimidine photo-lyase [Enterococcus faecalis]MCP9741229.1 deoxyribodipyrimidine photo-lyase [Enterococcus faecalis]
MKRVMWFRRDLRLQDNKALAHALQNSAADELILLFQMNPQQFIQESANHNAFFASLASFKERIDQEAHLQIMVGEPLGLFSRLKRKLPDWQAIYFNEDTCGFGAKRDQQAMRFFEENNIQSFSFQDAYLHGSEEIKKNDGSKYQVFTPYYNKWKEAPKETPIPVSYTAEKIFSACLFPEEEAAYGEQIARIPLKHYSVGEKTARRCLNTFIDQKLQSYENKRDFPYQDQTSHLSTFLRTGELSIRTIWQELASAPSSLSKETFKKELAWRDFYNMIYSAFPQQKEEAIQEKFRYIQWTNDPEMFAKWQKGETGYPIIDAAMRQLNQTGWMHNRLRMITASFLVKNLHIDWRWGEKYFQKMLIDYDAANNIGGWQWAASTGTDAVPYFRIFNPIIQSKKFDNDGQFIKKYVPELKQVPQKYIHQPNLMNEALQTQYHVHLGENYPKPIVDYASSKKQTLFLYEASKEIHQEMNNPRFQ